MTQRSILFSGAGNAVLAQKMAQNRVSRVAGGERQTATELALYNPRHSLRVQLETFITPIAGQWRFARGARQARSGRKLYTLTQAIVANRIMANLIATNQIVTSQKTSGISVS